jgi:hypothetical protein
LNRVDLLGPKTKQNQREHEWCKDGRIETKFKKRNEECRESRVIDERRILITVFSLPLLYHLSCIYS